MKILVVDDEQDIQLLFEQRFRREIRAGEFQFIYAFDAHEAVEILGSPDGADLVLILSDINMPGMSGLELLRYIREHRPALRVFMISAYGDDDSRLKASEYGADGFMDKPVDFTELKQKLMEFADPEVKEAE